jgi:hypothetical protein
MVKAQVQEHVMPVLMRSGMFSIMQKGDDGRGAKLDQTVRAESPKGLLHDPFTALDQLGFRERPTTLTFMTLSEMARKVPPFTAYLQTRLNQMAAQAKPQPDQHSSGFKIVLKDKQARLTPELQRRADDISRMVVRCGHPGCNVKRDKFGAWMRKTIWDSLVYDQWATEIVPQAGKDTPAYWRALDAATIRLADTLDELDEVDDSISTVQVYQDTVIAEWADEEMMFGVRNPRSDIRHSGYGFPELEMLVTIVTALLWGVDYNSKFFSQGSVAKGILNFKGAVPQKELESFKRHWYAMITGITNAWRTPVTNADDLQWVNMQSSNRDMEFSQWIDWLLKVTCAVVQIAPEEIGFQFGNAGQSSTLSEGAQADKLSASKDKGLVPLAEHIAEHLNDKVISIIDDRFQLEFPGISARSAEQLIDLQTKEVKTVKTVDEARKQRGEDPLPDGMGELILDPVWFQMWQAKQQAKQQQQPADGYGAPPGTPPVDKSKPWDGSGDDDDAGAANDDSDNGGQADGGDAMAKAGYGLSRAQARALVFEVDL